MTWVFTAQGERQLAEQRRLAAEAEMAKREGRPVGGTPAHAMADGAAEFHAQRRKELGIENDRDDADDAAEKVARHPLTGQFVSETRAAEAAFGLQRAYLAQGHAADSPGNAVGPHAAALPNVGAQVGYRQPIAEALASHGVPRSQVSYGPVGHEAPTAPSQLSVTRPAGALGSSLASNPNQVSVQHLDYSRGAAPVQVTQSAVRPDYHVAPQQPGAS